MTRGLVLIVLGGRLPVTAGAGDATCQFAEGLRGLPAGPAVAVLWHQSHAPGVQHAVAEDLDRLEALLTELRKLPQLRERKRGYFSRGIQAFLHFHEDGGDLYVDVRLDRTFQRMRITSGGEQAEFLARVREALQPIT